MIITSSNKRRILLMTCRFFTMFVIAIHSADADKSFTPVKCADHASYSTSGKTDNVQSRNAQKLRTYTGSHLHQTLQSNKMLKDVFSSLQDTRGNGVHSEHPTKGDSKYKSEDVIRYTKNRGSFYNHTNTRLHSTSLIESSHQSVSRSSSLSRQLQPLDPEFGSFYIQRKLWYVPLYFSVGFGLYLWSLLIKSLSRHRVYFPPPVPPPPPPPPPVPPPGPPPVVGAG